MKVHHIIDDICLENGGAQRIVRQLHLGLREHGIDSQVVALCESVDGIPDALSLGNPSPYSWQAFWSVYRYIYERCSPKDIIHGHLFPAVLYIALAVKFLRWKGRLVCTEHNTSNRRRSSAIGKLIDSLIYPSYGQIYCISEGTLKALQAWMPNQVHKLKVIENGTSLPFNQWNRREPREQIIIASAGRLHRQKNYANALGAMAMLQDINFEYRIAGIGQEDASLKALCTQLGLGEKVKFYGYVEDIFSFFKQSDIFLIPSLWEGFGLAAVEAMNAGLPVIASDVAGLREIINTSVPCGILVSPESATEIATAVRTLLNQEKRTIYGKRAFERSQDFSSKEMIYRYMKEYEYFDMDLL